jgi:pimeloyl-ACP methyl ester carboxylesterase
MWNPETNHDTLTLEESVAMIETRHIRADNKGVQIEAIEWAPATSLGVPIVFIPGGTGHALSGEDIGPEAAEGRIGDLPRRFLSISRRGTGRSGAPPTGYAPSDFAADVHAAATAADLGHFVLFGHSMGVPIALEYVLRHPDSVSGLVLGDTPAAYIDFKEAGTFDALLSYPFEFASENEAFEEVASSFSDRDEARRVFDRIKHRMFEPRGDKIVRLIDRAALARTVEESTATAREYWDDLHRLKCPVLVIRGTGGTRTPLSEEHLARYRGLVPRVTIEDVPGGHQLGLHGDRAPLRDAIGRFMQPLDRARVARRLPSSGA